MDSDLCPEQDFEGLWCGLLLALSTWTMVTLMLIFTCRKACKVKARRKTPSHFHHETPSNYEELESEVKFALDNKYSNIPEEYINERMDFLQHKRRFSSNSSGISSMSSAQYRSRSDSQAAVDTMLEWFVNPEHCEETKEPRIEDLEFKNALIMFSTTGKDISIRKSSLKNFKETKKSRRISWPDEEKNENNISAIENSKHRKNYNRSNSGLEVILEYDL